MKVIAFILDFVIPGVITFFVNNALGWNFGIMGAVWLYAMLFLCFNNMTQIKWKKNHFEVKSLKLWSNVFDTIAILVIIGVPVLAFGFGIHF